MKSQDKIENNLLTVEVIRDNHLEEHNNLRKIFQGTRFSLNNDFIFTPMQINFFRNAAVKLESSDLKMAHDLMELAFNARPEGPFIEKKLLEYKKIINGLIGDNCNSWSLAAISLFSSKITLFIN